MKAKVKKSGKQTKRREAPDMAFDPLWAAGWGIPGIDMELEPAGEEEADRQENIAAEHCCAATL